MSPPEKTDAMKKAWTYAVLDAVEAADENTRLEIARILCLAGFEIVEINESGQLGSLDALCRKTRLPETDVKNAVRYLVNIGFVEFPRQ